MTNIMIKTTLANLLKLRGRSLYWLAKETGIAYTTLHKLGKHETGGIDFRVLNKICGALECQPGDLLLYEPDKPLRKGTAR